LVAWLIAVVFWWSRCSNQQRKVCGGVVFDVEVEVGVWVFMVLDPYVVPILATWVAEPSARLGCNLKGWFEA
jgi:hypothetical protein